MDGASFFVVCASSWVLQDLRCRLASLSKAEARIAEWASVCARISSPGIGKEVHNVSVSPFPVVSK